LYSSHYEDISRLKIGMKVYALFTQTNVFYAGVIHSFPSVTYPSEINESYSTNSTSHQSDPSKNELNRNSSLSNFSQFIPPIINVTFHDDNGTQFRGVWSCWVMFICLIIHFYSLFSFFFLSFFLFFCFIIFK
jgi:hypothetical protein